MDFNILIFVSMLVAFVLTLLSGVVYIDFLKKKMYTQYILEDAPENHAKKAGTPTMGGIIFLLSVSIVAYIFFSGASTLAGVGLLVF